MVPPPRVPDAACVPLDTRGAGGDLAEEREPEVWSIRPRLRAPPPLDPSHARAAPKPRPASSKGTRPSTPRFSTPRTVPIAPPCRSGRRQRREVARARPLLSTGVERVVGCLDLGGNPGELARRPATDGNRRKPRTARGAGWWRHAHASVVAARRDRGRAVRVRKRRRRHGRSFVAHGAQDSRPPWARMWGIDPHGEALSWNEVPPVERGCRSGADVGSSRLSAVGAASVTLLSRGTERRAVAVVGVTSEPVPLLSGSIPGSRSVRAARR